MAVDLSQIVAVGVNYVRLEASLQGFAGGIALGWRDLPQVGVFNTRAYMNASIQALTIDPDSDWPWVGVRGPAFNNLQLNGPAPNTGLAMVGSPMLSHIISADVPTAQRVSPYGSGGAYAANIAALSYNPRDVLGIGTSFPIDVSLSNFYDYWDSTVSGGVFGGGLILRCTVWFAPLPPLALFPVRRYDWEVDGSFSLTGGGATDLVGKIPMFGRAGCCANSTEGTVGDVVTVKGINWTSAGTRHATTLFTVTVQTGGFWSFSMDNNGRYDAVEISYTKAGSASSMRVFAKAWDD